MMKNAIFTAVAFVMGAAAGVAGTYGYLKKTCEQQAQDEIESVKEIYSRKYKKYTDNVAVEDDKKEAQNIIKDRNYAPKIDSYSDYSRFASAHNTVEDEKDIEPYYITPDEFGDDVDYDTITLYYYSDGVLADENDELVENISMKVGKDYEEHFGDYDDDSVFVRNDILKCDFEILRDKRRYSDVIMTLPPKRGVDGI